MRKCSPLLPLWQDVSRSPDMMQISCQFEIRLFEKIRRFCQNRRVCGAFDMVLVMEK
ncbi:hypothetical protein IE4771_CH02203 [Rhizobium etli bv. mimosae str. IE4771]|uniref:Uncharacterized protein n=1 Tax=Rhizobium etli bv. mimosae str. IE4771 TaxID=1432050 RepID=A0A060I0H1_RHIET|nr:hypothetical protein IE4771_CH02203 [Rhizobium sp. IE4771]